MPKAFHYLPLLTQDASKSWDGNLVQLKHRFRQAVSHDSSHAVLKTCVGCQIGYLEVCHWLEGARESADFFKLSKIGLDFSKVFTCEFCLFMQCIYRSLVSLSSKSRPFKHKKNNIPTRVTMLYRDFGHFHRFHSIPSKFSAVRLTFPWKTLDIEMMVSYQFLGIFRGWNLQKPATRSKITLQVASSSMCSLQEGCWLLSRNR